MWNQGHFFIFTLTISRLSMPAFLILAATEFMSLSLIHVLNSLTANAADTPEKQDAIRGESEQGIPLIWNALADYEQNGRTAHTHNP